MGTSQPRARADLLNKLNDQLRVLQLLAAGFDAGERVLGYPIATTVRVHDTANSQSAVSQLVELTQVSFIDTAPPMNPNSLLSDAPLVLLRQTPANAEWVPRLVVPPRPGAEPREVPFSEWWTRPVVKDHKGALWSRRDIILCITNKEGGAHIDPNQPLDVRAIEHENSMGWSLHDPLAGDRPMPEGPLMPCVRQIAHEVVLSIDATLKNELS